MTYSEFISQFEIYESYNKAKAKGCEAHHITPRALQKDNETLDDRCVRLTPFEHIYAHYLLALEREDAVVVFFRMVCRNKFKLSDIEKVTLEELEEYGRLRSEGREKIAKARKAYLSDESHRQRISETKEAYFSDPENRRKQSETLKAYYLDPENRKHLSEVHMGHPGWNKGKKGQLPSLSEETRRKISETKKAYFSDPEHKRKLFEAKQQLAYEYRNNNPQGLSWNDFQKEYCKQKTSFQKA